MWKKGNKVAGEIKVAKQLTLEGAIYDPNLTRYRVFRRSDRGLLGLQNYEEESLLISHPVYFVITAQSAQLVTGIKYNGKKPDYRAVGDSQERALAAS